MLIAGWFLAAGLSAVAIALQLLGRLLLVPSTILEWRADRRNRGYWTRRQENDLAYMRRVIEETERSGGGYHTGSCGL